MSTLTVVEDSYQIQLPQFEGPFDLLLFFIQRDELDVYDIPIHEITNRFLAYIQQMEKLQISVAAEFIHMASQLMRIKAKMLIPRPQLDESGEVVDPRTDLVNRLMEYKLYKQASEELAEMEAAQALRLKRGYADAERAYLLDFYETPTDELQNLTLYNLMRTYQRVVEKHLRESAIPKHVIQALPYTLEEVRENIIKRVQGHPRVEFIELVQIVPERMYVVFTFLNVLEMVQQQMLHLTLGEGANNFWVSWKEAA